MDSLGFFYNLRQIQPGRYYIHRPEFTMQVSKYQQIPSWHTENRYDALESSRHKVDIQRFRFYSFLLDPSPCSGKAAVLWNRLTARCCLSFCLTQIHQGCQCWHYFPDSVHPNLPQFFTRLGGLQSGNIQVMVSLYLHSARRGFLPKCQSRCRVTGRTQLRWNM